MNIITEKELQYALEAWGIAEGADMSHAALAGELVRWVKHNRHSHVELKDSRASDAVSNLSSHYQPWREAIETMQTWAGRLIPPDSDEEREYWEHELKEFDEAFAALGLKA